MVVTSDLALVVNVVFGAGVDSPRYHCCCTRLPLQRVVDFLEFGSRVRVRRRRLIHRRKLLLGHSLDVHGCWDRLRTIVREEEVRWDRRVAIDGRVDWIILRSELVVTVGVTAAHSERTNTVSVEVAALYRLVIRVGDSIVALTESLSWDGVTRGAKLVSTVRK